MYTRDQIINNIINLVDVLNVKEIEGWEDIPFLKIKTLRKMPNLTTEELNVLLDLLVSMSDQSVIPHTPFETKIKKTKVELMQKENHTSIKYKKNELIEQIIDLVNEMELYNYKDLFEDWAHIPFSEIESLRDEDNLITQDLSVFLKHLENTRKQISIPLTEKWHSEVPIYVKLSIFNWNKLTIESIEKEVQVLLSVTNKLNRRDELEDFLGVLEDLQLEDELESYDPLEVLSKYKEGITRTIENSNIPKIDNSWRNMIPTVLKHHIKEWKTIDLKTFYSEARDLIEIDRKTIVPFVAELSQIVFDEAATEENYEQEEIDSQDNLADSIMSLVEMIIGPHLEVMDIIQKKGGNITFSNLWHKPFTEQLKKEVKDRDGCRCVICEGETDLHVHHKIPRNKGGIHHKDNLVTLCASCHGAIETADIKKAFKKCLTNYQKNKYSQLKPQDLLMDKKLLQEEVEKSLDHILLQLNQKDESKLMEEVIGVIQRLEVLFYG